MDTFTITQPTLLVIDTTAVQDPLCDGDSNGSLEITATGGTPNYTFTLNGTNQSNGVYTGLSAGNYTASVTDANGCTSNMSLTLNNPSEILLTVDATTDPTCLGSADGSVTLIAIGLSLIHI